MFVALFIPLIILCPYREGHEVKIKPLAYQNNPSPESNHFFALSFNSLSTKNSTKKIYGNNTSRAGNAAQAGPAFTNVFVFV